MSLALKKISPVFSIKNMIPFLSARFLFIFASQMQFTFISWQIYTMTKNVMYIGYLSLCELIPAFVLAFYGGYIVDLYQRSLILKTTLLVAVCSSLGLSLTMYFTQHHDYLIFAMMTVVFLSGVIRVFIGPVQTAMLGEIVPKEQYPMATTWHSGAWQIAVVAGPPLIGFLLRFLDAFYCQLCIVICFLMSLIFATLIKTNRNQTHHRKNTNETFVQSIQQGWQFVWHCKDLLGAFSLDMFAVFFGGATSLLPIFASEVYHVGTEGLGLLRAATSIGTILIFFLLALKPLQKNQGKILLISVFLFGVCMIIFGTVQSFWVGFIVLVLSGIFDGVSVLIRSTILQIKVPDETKGKVAAISTLFIMSSNELGGFESAITAKLFGTQNAVIIGGIATIIVVIAVYFLIPTLKKLKY